MKRWLFSVIIAFLIISVSFVIFDFFRYRFNHHYTRIGENWILISRVDGYRQRVQYVVDFSSGREYVVKESLLKNEEIHVVYDNESLSVTEYSRFTSNDSLGIKVIGDGFVIVSSEFIKEIRLQSEYQSQLDQCLELRNQLRDRFSDLIGDRLRNIEKIPVVKKGSQPEMFNKIDIAPPPPLSEERE